MYMNNTTVINIKTKKELKETAQGIASDLGLSLSAVLNGYLRQFVRNKAVYFSAAPQMTQGLEDSLRSIEYDIQRNKNLSKAISSKKELKKYLSSL